MIKIAPSILSADFANMGRDVKMLEDCGADYIHCDIMDGRYVPNITFGQQMVRSIKALTKLPMDVHLMVEYPEQIAMSFIDSGADIITFHPDACLHPHRLLGSIRLANVKAGIVLNPGMSVDSIKYLLDMCDMVLLMSVNPGFGGQSFIKSVVDKVRELACLRNALGLNFDIEIDGGINVSTAKQVTEAGANVLVAGNSIFACEDRARIIEELRG